MTAEPAVTSFAALHHRPGEPLLLPNAWDHASAAALAARGFPAIATTSLAVAAAAGLPDGRGATREHTLRLARTLGAEPWLLSVDAEDGFGDDPDEVARLADRLWDLGVVGINLEDGLGPAEAHAAKIAAVKAAVPGLFVNARTDTYWLGDGDETDTLRRLDAYRQAGADGLFVPGLTDPDRIGTLVRHVDAPLNVLYSPTGPTVPRLADLGVARVSLGSLLYRRALGAALDAVADIAAGRVPGGTTPSYAEVCALGGGAP
ncbi:2-methylisocitrate lyase-like PEP mutase family enzyme [Streptomyces griseochromogenes]|uniref:2-methylisocitrate lyase-like PEP mutase family enzyme n=1 Tax=Streptomyces griseochromogenes TaxID=68214 RepID=A0A1B1AUV2_9ACTN|nr:isocitrate lyase/phosphoenolpyruvate mutase family protein [Streptomyces griseochromogenes]ANP50300.1 phosphonomutase [Streptomyces griseochromogenes]MBP2048034.1 2-methylisocitrate lyase-like PEP mutase family enzyme [Streptomyces griseochromogenes]